MGLFLYGDKEQKRPRGWKFITIKHNSTLIKNTKSLKHMSSKIRSWKKNIIYAFITFFFKILLPYDICFKSRSERSYLAHILTQDKRLYP